MRVPVCGPPAKPVSADASNLSFEKGPAVPAEDKVRFFNSINVNPYAEKPAEALGEGGRLKA